MSTKGAFKIEVHKHKMIQIQMFNFLNLKHSDLEPGGTIPVVSDAP